MRLTDEKSKRGTMHDKPMLVTISSGVESQSHARIESHASVESLSDFIRQLPMCGRG
jgi:hypothetical protein